MSNSILDLPVLGDVLGFLGAAWAGWRYIFSTSYRSHVHLRWQSKSQLQIAQEITAAVAGSLFWLIIFCLIISFFAGFGWITRILPGTSSI